MADISIYNEMFELYLAKGKTYAQNKDYPNAKKFYTLAAKQMLLSAKCTTGLESKARLARAKQLLDICQSFPSGNGLVSASTKKEEVLSTALVINIDPVPLEEALAKLNSLIGLDDVKENVTKFVNQININKQREEQGLKNPPMTYHQVFLGNPGTGKTTVARILSQIYYALGITKENILVEVDKGDLVAGYIGQTALKTKEVIDSAMGGVLFIDEAYALKDDHFGEEAINTLLKAMEDKRDEFVVICAGYDVPMKKFIETNPGLESRFKNFIHFNDYSEEELFEILKKLLDEYKYVLTDAAEIVIKTYLSKIVLEKKNNFANARTVRNLFENIISAQSTRIAAIENPTYEDYTKITHEDVEKVVEF